MKILNVQNLHSQIEKPLPGPFQEVLEQIEAFPLSIESTILALFVESLMDSIEFDLNKLKNLSTASSDLCMTTITYCMKEGLCEDERSAISKAVEPYTSMAQLGTRH